MPGLRLSQAQACRLWQLDSATCAELLDTLVAAQVLHRLSDGTYVTFSGDHPSRPLKTGSRIDGPDPQW
jgi:hypothetical protein